MKQPDSIQRTKREKKICGTKQINELPSQNNFFFFSSFHLFGFFRVNRWHKDDGDGSSVDDDDSVNTPTAQKKKKKKLIHAIEKVSFSCVALV